MAVTELVYADGEVLGTFTDEEIVMKIIFTVGEWKWLRQQGLADYALWTDKELDNYDRTTMLIGNKCGVDCFVSKLS